MTTRPAPLQTTTTHILPGLEWTFARSHEDPEADAIGRPGAVGVKPFQPGPPVYSWHKDGQALPRASKPRLVLSGAVHDVEGIYTCDVASGSDPKLQTASRDSWQPR